MIRLNTPTPQPQEESPGPITREEWDKKSGLIYMYLLFLCTIQKYSTHECIILARVVYES